MGIRKKAKDKQRAMQVPSYTYARMTRRWRSAPNKDNCGNVIRFLQSTQQTLDMW